MPSNVAEMLHSSQPILTLWQRPGDITLQNISFYLQVMYCNCYVLVILSISTNISDESDCKSGFQQDSTKAKDKCARSINSLTVYIILLWQIMYWCWVLAFFVSLFCTGKPWSSHRKLTPAKVNHAYISVHRYYIYHFHIYSFSLCNWKMPNTWWRKLFVGTKYVYFWV